MEELSIRYLSKVINFVFVLKDMIDAIFTINSFLKSSLLKYSYTLIMFDLIWNCCQHAGGNIQKLSGGEWAKLIGSKYYKRG